MQSLGLQQWLGIGVHTDHGVPTGAAGVDGRPFTDQVERAFAAVAGCRLGKGLPLHKHIAQTHHRLEGHAGFGQKCRGALWGVGDASRRKTAGVVGALDRCGANAAGIFPNRALLTLRLIVLCRDQVGDGDFADAVERGVHAVEHQRRARLVVDLHIGVTVGHLQLAVAGAEHLAGDVDLAPGGRDRVQHDGLQGSIPPPADGHTVAAKAQTCQWPVAGIGQACGALRRDKRRGHVQGDGLHPALNHPIDVDVARVDVDRALGQHPTRLLAFCGEGERLIRGHAGVAR